MRAVILAGGKGTRLRPYTAILPKPLMPVGDRSVLEVLIRQLREHGVAHVTISLGHLAHLVEAVLGNGNSRGLKIDYTIEDFPLGTCGSLSLISGLTEPFFVLNGDVLTDLDFRELMDFHRSRNASITIAAYQRSVSIDYGVLRRSGHFLESYDEKPILNYEVSMGIYVFDPRVLEHIPSQTYIDFPDVVKRLLARNEIVSIYPFEGIWYDLGRQEDFVEVLDRLDELKTKIAFL
jgi:NDP-mannose synthase